MPTVATTPGSLNITVQSGDELSQLVNFWIPLSNYTFQAEIVSPLTYATLENITVTEVASSTGKLNLSMTESQTSAIPAGSYLWRFIWTSPAGVRRTVLEGIFEVTR